MRGSGSKRYVVGLLLGLSLFALIGAACSAEEVKAPAQPAAQPAAAASETMKAPEAMAFDAEAHFEGKTIQIVVGYRPGGGYDTKTRILANFFAKHIPGNPKLVVANVPGGGGLKAGRYVNNRKPNGLYMVNLPAGIPLRAIFGEDLGDYDPTKMRVLGNYELPTESYGMTCVQRDLATSWDEMIASGKVFNDGSSGVGNGSSMPTEWLGRVGQPIKVVYGYGGTSERMAAFDRGETDLVGCGPGDAPPYFDSIKRLFPEWLEKPTKMVPVISYYDRMPQKIIDEALTPLGWEYPPHAFDLLTLTEDQKAALELARAVRASADRMSLPPDTPDEIFDVLKQAYIDTVSSTEFIEAMNQRGYLGGHRKSEDIVKLTDQLSGASPELYKIVRGMFLAE